MSTITSMRLKVERTATPSADDHGSGPSGTKGYRPAGVSFQNDGFHPFWAVGGYSYHVEHDGTGFAVREYNVDGHVFRLASAPNTLTDTLPTVDGGAFTLDPARRYVITATVRVS